VCARCLWWNIWFEAERLFELRAFDAATLWSAARHAPISTAIAAINDHQMISCPCSRLMIGVGCAVSPRVASLPWTSHRDDTMRPSIKGFAIRLWNQIGKISVRVTLVANLPH